MSKLANTLARKLLFALSASIACAWLLQAVPGLAQPTITPVNQWPIIELAVYRDKAWIQKFGKGGSAMSDLETVAAFMLVTGEMRLKIVSINTVPNKVTRGGNTLSFLKRFTKYVQKSKAYQRGTADAFLLLSGASPRAGFSFEGNQQVSAIGRAHASRGCGISTRSGGVIKPRRRDQAIAVAFASPISDAEIAALRKNGAIRQGTSNSRVRLQYTAQVVAHELLHSFGVVEHFDVQREMNATAEFDRLTNIAIMESNISYLAPPAWAVSKRSYAQVRTFLSLLNATQSNCLRETGNRSLTLKKKSKKRKRRK